MTDNQKRAIDAIKAATGWDAEPSSQGAKVQRPNVTSIYVWWSRSDKWKCEITPKGWTGEGSTPEEAIDAVLPRYRAQIANLAADILPGWPHLEWQRDGDALCLVMLAYGVRTVLLDGQLFENGTGWIASKYQDIAGYVSTKADIIKAAGKWHAANMPELPLPSFPETPNA